MNWEKMNTMLDLRDDQTKIARKEKEETRDKRERVIKESI